MKAIIVGSTGSVGRKLVRQALEMGHEVTAFTRDSSKLEVVHDNLRIVQGDVLHLPGLEKAMKGQEAVLCAIGAGRQGRIRSEGTRNIILAMKNTGVRRLICQSTLGVGDSQGNLNFFWKHIMFGFFLRKAFEDHIMQENHVVQSGLDWTIVRPAAFTDGNRTGNYRHGFPGSDTTTDLKIARADVADFMLKQLSDNTYLLRRPGLSY